MVPSQPDYHDVVPIPCLYQLSPAIGKLTYLTHLYLQGHAISADHLIPFIANHLSKLKNLKVLDLTGYDNDGLISEPLSRLQAKRIQRLLPATSVWLDSSVFKNIRMRPVVKMWIDSVTNHDSTEFIKQKLKQDIVVEQSYARLLKIIPDMTSSLQIEFTILNGNRTPLKVVSKVYDGFTGKWNLYEPTNDLKPLIQPIQASAFKRLPVTSHPVFIRVWYELSAVEE